MAKKENTTPAEEVLEEETANAEDPCAKLQQELDETKDRYLRLAAEYENFRKRTAREKETLFKDGSSHAIAQLLSVYDNLERAVNQPTDDEAYKKGVELTFTQLKETLDGMGVSLIAPLGEVFDPNFHNAVMHVEDDTLGENVVAEVFQTGFRMGDRVIRYAIVKVAN